MKVYLLNAVELIGAEGKSPHSWSGEAYPNPGGAKLPTYQLPGKALQIYWFAAAHRRKEKPVLRGLKDLERADDLGNELII